MIIIIITYTAKFEERYRTVPWNISTQRTRYHAVSFCKSFFIGLVIFFCHEDCRTVSVNWVRTRKCCDMVCKWNSHYSGVFSIGWGHSMHKENINWGFDGVISRTLDLFTRCLWLTFNALPINPHVIIFSVATWKLRFANNDQQQLTNWRPRNAKKL